MFLSIICIKFFLKIATFKTQVAKMAKINADVYFLCIGQSIRDVGLLPKAPKVPIFINIFYFVTCRSLIHAYFKTNQTCRFIFIYFV